MTLTPQINLDRLTQAVEKKRAELAATETQKELRLGRAKEPPARFPRGYWEPIRRRAHELAALGMGPTMIADALVEEGVILESLKARCLDAVTRELRSRDREPLARLKGLILTEVIPLIEPGDKELASQLRELAGKV